MGPKSTTCGWFPFGRESPTGKIPSPMTNSKMVFCPSSIATTSHPRIAFQTVAGTPMCKTTSFMEAKRISRFAAIVLPTIHGLEIQLELKPMSFLLTHHLFQILTYPLSHLTLIKAHVDQPQ